MKFNLIFKTKSGPFSFFLMPTKKLEKYLICQHQMLHDLLKDLFHQINHIYFFFQDLRIIQMNFLFFKFFLLHFVNYFYQK